MLHILAVTYFQPTELTVFVSSLVLQTNPDWELWITHDGPIPEDVLKIMSIYNDPRIHLTYSEIRHQKYGHPNRKQALSELNGLPNDYVLLTNCDNYYVPTFVEQMMAATKYMRINGQGIIEENRTGIVSCDTIHSHLQYALHKSQLYEGGIDLGAFIVRFDVSKEVGFVHENFSADGRYAEECKKMCDEIGAECRYIPKALFVHN